MYIGISVLSVSYDSAQSEESRLLMTIVLLVVEYKDIIKSLSSRFIASIVSSCDLLVIAIGRSCSLLNEILVPKGIYL